MDKMKHRRLQELDRSDFGIVEGEPDIRGWDVRNTSGQKIGEVEELIIDAQQKKVRYLVVELDDDDLDLEDDKKVLIPIGLAELDKEEDDVILPSVDAAHLNALPAYDADNLDDALENEVRSVLSSEVAPHTVSEEDSSVGGDGERPAKKRRALIIDNTSTSRSAELPAIGTPEYYASFYQHPYFNDENLGRQRSQPGHPVAPGKESDYERGLHLWEMRNESRSGTEETGQRADSNTELSNEDRREKFHQRRTVYEERRKPRKGKSIIDRINEEGLQEAKPDQNDPGKISL